MSDVDSTPINIIIRETKFSSAEAISLITGLELKGLVEADRGRGYIKTI